MVDTLLLAQNRPSADEIALARDAYDDCVADLDEELGRLIDELERRAILERTWVIIVADHGESFGEHPGVFRHGTSLYQTELHVPLLIIPPLMAGNPLKAVVSEPVSLRDLAATIVERLGLQKGSPFPGRFDSPFLQRIILGRPGRSHRDRCGALRSRPARWTQPGSRAIAQAPLAARFALARGDWKYIRREGDTREELFHLRDDPQELNNLAGNPAMWETLKQLRLALSRLTAGPLTPQRFNP